MRRNSWLGMLFATAAMTCAAIAGEAVPATGIEASLRDYYSANGLLNRGLHELAVTEYRKFLSAHGDHEKSQTARYGLAVCLYRLRQYDDAVAELARLRQQPEVPNPVEVATILGQCHLAGQRYADAARVFEEVVREHVQHDLADDAAAGAAEAYYLDGRYDQAISACRLAVSRWPSSPLRERVEFFWGLAEMAQRDYAEAAGKFDRILKAFPDGPFADQASFLLAECYHHDNLIERSISQYRNVLKRTGTRFAAGARYGLGLLMLRQGKAKEAGKLFDQLIEKYPDSSHVAAARFQRGRTWFEQGAFDRALALFQQCAAEQNGGPLEDDVAYWTAKCALRQGHFAEAAEQLTRSIQEHASSELLPEMHYDRALALVRAGRHGPGIEALMEFRRRFADHDMAADALYMLATTEHQQRRYDESRTHCRTFIDSYPSHELAATVAFLWCENEFLAGRYSEAVDAYRRFLQRFPTDGRKARGQYRLGIALYRLERLDEAERILAETEELAKTDDLFHFGLFVRGDICFQRGEWGDAERLLSNYLLSVSDLAASDDALLKLGLALQRQGKHSEALPVYSELIEEHRRSPHRLQAVFERGQALVALGRLDEAGDDFERVLSDGGDSRFKLHALSHLGSIAMGEKDFTTAARLLDGAAKSDTDGMDRANLMFRRGQALFAGGEFAEAESVLGEFLDRYPSHTRAAEACARLAMARSRQDKHTGALEMFDRLERDFADKLDPALDASVDYEKAWCLGKVGRDEQAARIYRRLVDDGAAGDYRIHSLFELAGIELAANRYQSAAELFSKLRAEVGDGTVEVPADIREQSTYQLAICEFELGRMSEAADLLEEFISLFPESRLMASASYFCGDAQYRSGRPDRAAIHLTRVMEDFPDDDAYGPALLRLGQCLAKLQHWPRSEQVFAEYLNRFAESDQSFQARFGVGWARENQNRYDEAISAYTEVVADHQGPTAARAQFQIGECLFAKKEYENAARELLKVDILYAYPEWSAAALYEAGQCFERLSKLVEARAQFKAVARKFPETQWARLASQRLAEVSTGSLLGR